MIAVFGTTYDCFVFTPWTGLQVKRATSVIDNCINKAGIKCSTFNNAIKQFHKQRVSTTEKAEKKKKKVVRLKACSAKKVVRRLPNLPDRQRRPWLENEKKWDSVSKVRKLKSG